MYNGHFTRIFVKIPALSFEIQKISVFLTVCILIGHKKPVSYRDKAKTSR